jgi:hypothetical protein
MECVADYAKHIYTKREVPKGDCLKLSLIDLLKIDREKARDNADELISLYIHLHRIFDFGQ